MTLKQINQFATTDPEKLGRQLSAFEDNVHTECSDIRLNFAPVLDDVSRVALPAPAPTAFALLPDQQAAFDTTRGNLTAILPPLSPKNFGRRFVVIMRTARNTLNVICQDSAVRINGSAFPLAITATGVTVFYCDAAGYYK